MKIIEILNEKGSRKNIVTVPSGTSLREVAVTLCEHGIGALLVTRPGTDPVQFAGIVSERDMLRAAAADDDFRNTPVDSIMTRDMIIATPDDDVDYVMLIMTRKHIRHIPIVENGNITGILSIRDIVNSMLQEKNIRIRHLSDYVAARQGK